MLKIVELKIEDQIENIVADNTKPQFCIVAESDHSEDKASAWQIIVSDEKKTVWDSGKVSDEETNYIAYQGQALAPHTNYQVMASVWNSYGELSQKTGTFRTGFLGTAWQGKWITHPTFSFNKKENPPAFVFQKTVSVSKKAAQAYLYTSALGVYTVQMNGIYVGNDMLAPGYTSYENQIQYQTYDVTELVKKLASEGRQLEMCATVAGGWAVATFGPFGTGQHAGKKQAFISELHMIYEDGTKEIISTEDSWTVSAQGAVKEASVYDGERIDARIDENSTDYQKSFVKCQVLPQAPTKQLIATYGELPRRIKTLAPVSEHQGKNGIIFDFGQNFQVLFE